VTSSLTAAFGFILEDLALPHGVAVAGPLSYCHVLCARPLKNRVRQDLCFGCMVREVARSNP
jgi:hypothetical protein